jgi:hypothetical protein
MIAFDDSDLAGTAWGADFDEELAICRSVLFPLRGHIIFIEDGLDGADRLAGAAINALVWLDVEHALALINAINRTLFDARLVFHINTRLGNYVGHADPFQMLADCGSAKRLYG